MAAERNPVAWLLSNREAMVGVFMLVAWLFRKSGLAKDKTKEAKPKLNTEEDSEALERTRRIQEEVRRKINERKNAPVAQPVSLPSERVPAPPLIAPRPIATSPGDIFRELFERRELEPEKNEYVDLELEASLKRQKELEEKMRALELAAKNTQESVSKMREPEQIQSPRSTSSTPHAWIHDLRDPALARKAIVLREILNPPVALRG
jgi:hypothetical protein